MTDEDDEFVRIEKESLWRKRQIEENLGQPVYFKPKKKWVGLEDKDVATVKNDFNRGALWAEAVLKEKNDA